MQKWKTLTSLLPAAIFPFAALAIGLRNPSIFQAPSLLSVSPLPAILFFLAPGALFFLQRRSARIRADLPGAAMFFLFSAGYFLLASLFNRPEVNTNNIYFAADSWSWYQRMADESGWNVGTRAVHPFAHIIFRPLVAALSLSTGGDRFHANLILLALAGGGCVFVMWKIVKQISGDQTHAVLFASLLGLSASHLIFASVIESYIFSTLGLLSFVWLIINNKSLYTVIVTSVVTFGITATNIVQQGLTDLLVKRNIKRTIILFSLAILGGIVSNIISRYIYPPTEYFFLPQNLGGELRFLQEITLKRTGLLAENLFIYNVAAPRPYSSIRNGMPRFNFLNGTIQEYAWFGWPALILWIAALGLAFHQFNKNIRSHTTGIHLAVAMLACLMFNFLLHIGYGIEPFLYSADWTYALILLTAIALVDLAGVGWFTMAVFTLVTAIFINNLWFLYFISRQVGEYLVQ